MYSKKLWTLDIDFGRSGQISSTFLATQDQVDKLRGKSVYMSDVLGKHSEVTIVFDDSVLSERKLSAAAREELEAEFGNLIGGWFYPWDYSYQWEEEEDE